MPTTREPLKPSLWLPDYDPSNGGAMPDGSGTFTNDSSYRNDRLNLTIEVPGVWHFFDRDK